MNQLPTDLVRAIAGFVHRKDILSFRLTCRSFAALGLSRQFEVIPVILFRHSLDNLRRISENPIYRNHVLTIEYGPGIIADPISRRFWFDNIKEFLRPEDYDELGDYDEPADYDEPFFDIKVEEACMYPDSALHPHACAD